MAYYFHLSNGLRGCYMPDSHHVVMVTTRKELKRIVINEAQFLTQGEGDKPVSKRLIASVVANVWRARGKTTLDYCLPISEGYGLFVSPATRADYLESRERDHD